MLRYISNSIRKICISNCTIMNRKSTFLLCIFLAVASADIQPLDLEDQVREELEALESIVQGQILAAHDELDNAASDFRTNSGNVANEGAVAIEQEEQLVEQQLQTIKDLAFAAGVDISSCTNIREQTLRRLPQQLIEAINTCISDINAQATSTATDGRYLVDVVINKVHDLKFQLNQCRGDLLCISPLLSQVELNKIRLPQNIDAEVLAVQGLLRTLEISVQTCSDSRVSQYSIEGYAILADIQACANRLTFF